MRAGDTGRLKTAQDRAVALVQAGELVAFVGLDGFKRLRVRLVRLDGVGIGDRPGRHVLAAAADPLGDRCQRVVPGARHAALAPALRAGTCCEGVPPCRAAR